MKIPYFKYCTIIIILSLAFEVIGNNNKEYQIEKRIVIQKGLSQNRILSILEDDLGFMWFGTADGLNRYDGYNFKIYRNKFDDSTSLPNNSINTMVEDDQGNFWIGTNNGIANFNPYSNQSINYIEEDSSSTALGANFITASAIDSYGNIWFGTNGYGVIRLNPKSLEKEHLFYSETDSIQLNSISNLFIDSKDRLWFGSFVEDKVLYYDIKKQKIESFDIELKEYQNNKKVTKIFGIYEDPSERIWISALNYQDTIGGIYYHEKGTNEFLSYNKYISAQNKEAYYDCYNTIHSITGDSTGNIWFSSVLGGLFKFQFGENPEAYFVESPISDSRIYSIYRSSNGLIWIGTNGHGLEISIPASTDFNIISESTNSNFEIESIRAICEGKDNYWVGGYYGFAKISKDFQNIRMVHYASLYSLAIIDNMPNYVLTGSEGGGLRLFDIESEEMVDFSYNEDDSNITNLKYIYVIYPLNDTLILLGTDNGLYGVNTINHNTYKFPFNPQNSKEHIEGVAVRTIYTDRYDNTLIGYVKGGVGKLDLQKQVVDVFSELPDFANIHNFNPINSIYQDKTDKYWLATSNGLLKLSDNKDFFVLIAEENGLPNSHIYSILPDKKDNLWMSTNNGLCCFSPDGNIFRNYDVNDGLQNNEFNTGAFGSSSNGDLFFGGISGFNYFNPEKIKQNSIIPKLVITDIKSYNNRICLSKDELEKGVLEIPSDNEVFTIEFAGLSFINSQNNNYTYFVSQLGDEWIDLEDQHEITFYGLSPGTYNLQIMASNNHGLWLKKPFKLTILVYPKFYESNLFKWLMTILLAILIIIGIRIRLRNITGQKNKLQLLVNEKTSQLTDTNKDLHKEIEKHSETAKELVKTIKTKDRFLSIIAHDIMGPLGVIQGFTDILINNYREFTEEEKQSFVKTINSTVKELSSLLTNLLQWSRIQNNNLEPQLSKINVLHTLNEVLQLLQGNINKKEITLIVNIDKNETVYADRNMLLTIFRNLISNALKFTPENGQIAINSMQKEDKLEVNVSDTGVGIKEEDIKKLFNTDLNFSTKGTNNEAGTGLGLNLVNEFITLLGGKLWIKSAVNHGTIIYFTLPLKK